MLGKESARGVESETERVPVYWVCLCTREEGQKKFANEGFEFPDGR